MTQNTEVLNQTIIITTIIIGTKTRRISWQKQLGSVVRDKSIILHFWFNTGEITCAVELEKKNPQSTVLITNQILAP